MNSVIIGAGAWGTAFAIHLGRLVGLLLILTNVGCSSASRTLKDGSVISAEIIRENDLASLTQDQISQLIQILGRQKWRSYLVTLPADPWWPEVRVSLANGTTLSVSPFGKGSPSSVFLRGDDELQVADLSKEDSQDLRILLYPFASPAGF